MPGEDEPMAEQSNTGLGLDYIMSLENVPTKLHPQLQIFNDAGVHVNPIVLKFVFFFSSSNYFSFTPFMLRIF